MNLMFISGLSSLQETNLRHCLEDNGIPCDDEGDDDDDDGEDEGSHGHLSHLEVVGLCQHRNRDDVVTEL